MTSNSKQNRQKKFRKQKVENAALYKLVLNKTMSTHEECIKLNFVAPLI